MRRKLTRHRQSPTTAETRSPGTPWFPDRDGYTETALSSPLNSSWPRTIGSSKNPGPPHARLEDHSEPPFPDLKGKGVEKPYNPRPDPAVRFLLEKQLFHDPYYSNLSTVDNPSTAATATTIIPSPTTPSQKPPPTQVHVLILTWAKHSRRGSDGQLLTPSLDNDTETLRATLKRRGYSVQCRVIPTDYPTAAVETMLDRFLERSARESLLVVYYHGFGCLERDGRMVFAR